MAADNVLEIQPLEFGGEGVADLMRGEEDAPAAVDTDRVGQLKIVGFDGRPDLRAGELRGNWSVEQPADRGAGTKQFFPIGGVGEIGIVDERFGFEEEAVAVDGRGALKEHFDTDAGQGTTFGEFQVGEAGLKEIHLGDAAWPEGQSEGNGGGAFVFYREDLSIGAVPEFVFVHAIG